MKKILLLSLAFLTLAAPAWASELFGKISYKGAPLKDAEVAAGDKSGKTNALGFYSLTLDPGAYTLKVKLPDGTTREEKVDVFPQATEKNLKLE
ncbi:carboxypeptidase regulatory-like domain-containing protein [Deltaproteobacteria bacterium PRO3]|nr:carboxypeptidase regulatory-like domain-containing protein [Deltaproteobacteria bacterium PRO3]